MPKMGRRRRRQENLSRSSSSSLSLFFIVSLILLISSCKRVQSVLLVTAATATVGGVGVVEEVDNTYYDTIEYILIGVSGGLQDGFRGRNKMNYIDNNNNKVVKAIFLGKVFVRGYKSFLDIMEEGWRQYVEKNIDISEGGTEITGMECNPNVIATGCYEHANEHYLYAVDARQVLSILMNEPRFLSITPDTGLVDISIKGKTSPLIRKLAWNEIRQQKKSNYNAVAFPLVTAVWHQESSLIPSPPYYTIVEENDNNGNETIITKVTTYPESLELWAGIDPNDRLSYIQAYEDCLLDNHDDDTMCDITDHESYRKYWGGLVRAIRKEEFDRSKITTKNDDDKLNFYCKKKVKFGVDKNTARINYSFTGKELKELVEGLSDDELDNNNGSTTLIKYHMDHSKGKLVTTTTTKLESSLSSGDEL